MTRVIDIYEKLQALAPLSLAESWDNPGMLAGDGQAQATRVLIALDITPPVLNEAAEKGAQLVVSHHPVIFKPVKSVLREGPTAVLWELIHSGLAAVCMHTNLDIARGGVNDTLCARLGLQKESILQVTGRVHYKKIVTFVPREQAEAVREALAKAGAGKLGAYDGCAFEADGRGTFRPLTGAKPFVGRVGQMEQVEETRIEAICDPRLLGEVLAAMKAAHPYEVPAYDVFDDEAVCDAYGIGALASVGEAQPLERFAHSVNERLSAGGVRICDAGKPVRRLAVCSGAWDDELTLLAKQCGADTILTGEVKHSAMLLALACGLNVVAAGHFATENVICEPLARQLREAFPQVAFDIAQSNTDPSRLVNG